MNSVMFLVFANTSVTIKRYLLVCDKLISADIKPYIFDFSGKLKEAIQDHALMLNLKQLPEYLSAKDYEPRQVPDEFFSELQNTFTGDKQENDIKKLLDDLNFDPAQLIDLHKDEVLNPFLFFMRQSYSVLENIQPVAVVYDIELDRQSRAMILTARKKNVKVISLQHGEGNSEQYEQLPLLADYYIAYSPYNCKKLVEMGVPVENILFTGSPDTDLIQNFKIANIINEFSQIDFDKNKKNILIALKPNNCEEFRNANYKMIDNTCKVFGNDAQYNILIKQHPSDLPCGLGIEPMQEQTKEFSNVVVLPGNVVISKLYLVSDYLITPFSTALVEAVAMGTIPIVVEEDTEVAWPDWNFYNIYKSVSIDKMSDVLLEVKAGGLSIEKDFENNRNDFTYFFRYKIDTKNSERAARILKEIISKQKSIEDFDSCYNTQRTELLRALGKLIETPHKRISQNYNYINDMAELLVNKKLKRKIKIFTKKNWLVDKQNHISLLIPFWGDIPVDSHDPSAGRFDEWIKIAEDLFEISSLEDADVFLLPGDYNPNSHSEYVELAILAGQLQKKLLLFCSSDYDQKIEIPNSLIFRTSFYNSQRAENEFAIPAFCQDFIKKSFGGDPQFRTKGDQPVVSFCGLVPGNENNPAYVRKWAVDHFTASKQVKSNFVIHDKFWGGAIAEGGLTENALDIHKQYLDNLREGDFVINARGAGNFSFRFYETLCAGRIPAFINTDCVLPFENLIDWKNLIPWVEIEELDQASDIVCSFYDDLSEKDYLSRQKECRRIWKEHLSPEGFFKTLHSQLISYLKLENVTDSKTEKILEPELISKIKESKIEEYQSPLADIYPQEKAVIRVLENLIKPGWRCVDVGANFGVFSIMFSFFSKEQGEVFAFEAHPDNCRIINDNISGLKLNNIRIENFAVSDGKEKSIKLYSGRNKSPQEWNILGYDVEGKPTESVGEIGAVSLDEYFADKGFPDFVKIDIEGAGGFALEGMRKMMKEKKPVVLIEFHDDTEWSSREILYEYGYNIWDLKGNYINPSKDTPRTYHCIAF